MPTALGHTRSQTIAILASAGAIKSMEQCKAVLEEISRVDCPECPAGTVISRIEAKDITSSSALSTLRKNLPALIEYVNKSANANKSFADVIKKAQAVLAYLGSESYEKELAARLIERGFFDDYIERKIAEGLAGGGDRRRSSGAGRKARNVALEDHVHFAVADLVFVKYRKKAYTVHSPLKTWPAPTDEGSEEVDDGEGGKRIAWRPNWNDFHSGENEEFIDEVLLKIESEFEGQHTSEEVRAALEVFFESIVRQRREIEKGVDEQNKASRRKNARTKNLSDNISLAFPKSLLEQCKEKDLLLSAIRSGAFYIGPLARKEAHGLPTPSTSDEGEQEGFDGFQLFLEYGEGKVVPDNAVQWVVREPCWWSDVVRLGYWTLYEQGRPSDSQKPRTPIFHVPSPYQQPLSLSSLPLLAPSDMTAAAAKKANRSVVSRGMISDAVLEAEPYQDWAKDLRDDPASNDDKPSLRDLLSRPENAGLFWQVNEHMRARREYDDEVYERMWELRQAGRIDDYVKALRAEDSQAFLSELDRLADD